MTITILSSTSFDSGFGPTSWRFGISSGDAATILTNPNALNVNFNGVLKNINAMYYAAGLTQPPFGLLWNVVNISVGVPSPGWYVVLLPTTNFGILSDWDNFDGPYDAAPGVTHSIAFAQKPQTLMPVYNPITYNIFSGLYGELGYRYLINVKRNGTETIGTFKLVPGPDGGGYIDLSSILSNYTTHNFNTTIGNVNMFESYVNYSVEFGEEYVDKWLYTNVIGNTASGLYNNYAVLNQSNPSILHTYVVGDQITIDTVISGTTSTINGLHSIVEVPSSTRVVIDVPFPGASGSSIGVSGSSIYSDSRKIAYTGITASGSLYAFNGAMDWEDWKGYTARDYIISGSASVNNDILLTSVKPYTSTLTEDRYYATDFQQLWFNFFVNNTDETHRVVYSSDLDAEQTIVVNHTTSNIRRFYFNFEYLMSVFSFNSNLSYIEFYVKYDNLARQTQKYRIYRDKRCAINEIQVAFLDRMGSILTIPFTLRMGENLSVEREKFKSATIYGNNTSFDLTGRGESITDVKIDREYSLETNWMNDAQMSLYEELISSPATWVNFGDTPATDVWHSCIIQDGTVQIDRQKNKRIFRKSCKIKLANTQNINI